MLKTHPIRNCPECGKPLIRPLSLRGGKFYECDNPECWVYSVVYTGKGNIIRVIKATAL